MILLSLMLVAVEDPAAVTQDARCAAVMLAVRDSIPGEGKDEIAAASAAAAYYVGKLEGYYATLPQVAFAPMTPFDRTRNAILDANRKVRALDEPALLSAGKTCFQSFDRMLTAL